MSLREPILKQGTENIPASPIWDGISELPIKAIYIGDEISTKDQPDFKNAPVLHGRISDYEEYEVHWVVISPLADCYDTLEYGDTVYVHMTDANGDYAGTYLASLYEDGMDDSNFTFSINIPFSDNMPVNIQEIGVLEVDDIRAYIMDIIMKEISVLLCAETVDREKLDLLIKQLQWYAGVQWGIK